MKAGTRITRGVMRPPSPVNIASVRAGSSSPAPPGPFSGEVGTSVSVGACGSSAVGAGTLSVVSVVSACVSVAVSVSEPAAGSSSSPPQPASASMSATARTPTNDRLKHLRRMPITDTSEDRCGGPGHTVIS